MVSLPKNKVKTFLNRICSRVEQGPNHEKFFINIDNMELLVPLIRGTDDDIREKLAGKMATQLRISDDGFANLVRRKGKYEDYSKAYFNCKNNLKKSL